MVSTDVTSLLGTLMDGLPEDDRGRVVELLNTPREDSGARLDTRPSSRRGVRLRGTDTVPDLDADDLLG